MSEHRLVIANWKMNPATIGEAKKLFLDLRKKIAKGKQLKAIIAPPFPFIADLRKLAVGKSMMLGAQDVHQGTPGPHTGAVSARMLKSLGVSYVIVGHSERRAEGDTDEMVNLKVRLVLKEQLIPILCVGERERDTAGAHYAVVENQLKRGLTGVSRTELARVVLAYEPVWAISTGDGKGATATPEHAHEMKIFIQKVLVGLYGRKLGMSIRILYGGSVNALNARELIAQGEIDGFLVGGASLKPGEFLTIVEAALQHVRS